MHVTGGSIRSYRDGDERQLAALWERAYAGYGGFVRRTAEYWRWANRDRPGVDAEDILLLEDGDRLLGYGVLGPAGAVLEFAVDTSVDAQRRRSCIFDLLEALEDRALVRGDYSLNLKVPGDDPQIVEALREKGYLEEERTSGLQLIAVDVGELLERLLAPRAARLRTLSLRRIRLLLRPGSCSFCPYPELSIILDPLSVTPVAESKEGWDATVEIELSALIDAIFRRCDLGEVRSVPGFAIRPASARQDVAAVLEALIVDSPWYTPMADER